MKIELNVTAVIGDVLISEDDLKSITDKDLAKLGMSREELHRCFAEGVRLMKGHTASDLRPVAYQTYEGKWEVRIIQPYSDPLMEDSGRTEH